MQEEEANKGTGAAVFFLYVIPYAYSLLVLILTKQVTTTEMYQEPTALSHTYKEILPKAIGQMYHLHY